MSTPPRSSPPGPSGALRPGGRLALVTSDRLAVGGEAVARAPDGRVVFVRGAAPDERLDVRLTEVKKRFARADAVQVRGAGPDRVEPRCAHFGTCGGCTLMHLDPAAQVRLKRQAGLQTLARVGGLRELPADIPTWSAEPLGTRTRARFAVSGSQVGFREARSHRVVSIDRCLAIHPRLDAARSTLRSLIEAGSSPSSASPVEEVQMVTDGREVAVALPPSLRRLEAPLRRAGLSVLGRRPGQGGASGARGNEGELRGEDLAGPFVLRPDVFAQASAAGNRALLEAVAGLLPASGGRAVELYAGSGNLTRLLAARFAEVTAVERSAEAVGLGRRLELDHVEWLELDAAEGYAAAGRRGGLELLLVDPPRAGLEPELREILAADPPARTIYVSCDVATLARDLGRLLADPEMRVASVQALDLYPQTPHLEWIVGLERRSG